MTLEWKWEEKVFDVFLSHKITDAKDIVLSWYNTLSAMEYKPFLDRLTLDKVENIPMYVEQTVTVAIAVSTNLFQSYWCAVELCKATSGRTRQVRPSCSSPRRRSFSESLARGFP